MSTIAPLRGASTRRARRYVGRPLIDVAATQELAVGHLLTTPAAPLREAVLPVGPGIYALSYSGSNRHLQHFGAARSII